MCYFTINPRVTVKQIVGSSRSACQPFDTFVEYKFMITQKKPTGTIGSMQTFYFK